MSPDGRHFVDTYSTPTTPPVMVLRDASGRVVQTLERTDVSRLAAAGWKAPTPIRVKARDGKTDLYGLMFTPTTLDSARKYPIINYIYPGPQSGSVGSRSFSPHAATTRRWRSWASSSWRSTGWGRPAAPRRSPTRTTDGWATTRSPTRWRA
jgi:dipeptidyl aminopeptidase/acylaminoacyl peptidase